MDTERIYLKKNWKFNYGEAEEAWYKGFDDSQWENIIIPHDWSTKMPLDKSYSSGTGYAAGGIGWYRIHFMLPEHWADKHISIVFEGVYKNSQVWCNSYYMGKRPYGYSQFCYDLSSRLHFGDRENVITVKVSHQDIADSRWFTGSGINRDVYIMAEEQVHMVNNGCFFSVETADERLAKLSISNELVNDSSEKHCFIIRNILKNSDADTVSVCEKKIELEPGEKKTEVLSSEVIKPELWSAKNPYLYTLYAEIEENGKKSCVYSTKTGIRTFEFHPDGGFFINGKSEKLKGVCVHHDGGCLGAAMYREVWKRRLALLKDMGCNAVRTSHNPHMPQLYELCDEMGFYMMDEAFDEWENPKNKWSTGHNVYPPKHQGYAEDFPQWHDADLRTMVRRDRNHPSVIMWSIGNEIDYPNDPYCHPMFRTMTGNNDKNKPARERAYDPDKPDASRLPVIASELAAIVRDEDKTRPVTLAAAFPELTSHIGYFDSLDIVGYNYKEHLYEDSHRRFPDKPFLGSENGHGYREWLAVKNNEYISGQFLWTGIDYLGESRGTWPIHGSAAGEITMAGFPKEGFYKRKSWWSSEPTAFLLTGLADEQPEETWMTGEWKQLEPSWNYSQGDTVTVRCYTELVSVKLMLNGREIEGGKRIDEYGCFEWTTAYEPGRLWVIAGDESHQVHYELETAGKADHISACLWKDSDSDEKPEVEQIEIHITDACGRTTAFSDQMINVTVKGDGVLLGIESGDLSDASDYTLNRRKTFKGDAVAYILHTGDNGFEAEISADGLQSASVRA